MSSGPRLSEQGRMMVVVMVVVCDKLFTEWTQHAASVYFYFYYYYLLSL